LNALTVTYQRHPPPQRPPKTAQARRCLHVDLGPWASPVVHHARVDRGTQHADTHIKSIEYARVLRAGHLEFCGPVILGTVVDEDVPMLGLKHLVEVGRVGGRGSG